MNDDLTPEEREALAGLPRERTPSAGLEDRVVAAMRERGHLARKPARVIRLTTTRVAGLLAASVVLVIGAYSIGLNRGVNKSVLTNVEPRGTGFTQLGVETREEARDTGVRPPATNEAAAPATESPPATAREQGFIDKTAPPLEFKLNTPQLATQKDAKKELAKEDEVTESMATSSSSRIAEGRSAPAPAANTPAQLKARADVAPESPAQKSRTFALPGGTLIVEAPDSVRVVTDEQGRTLLIYTSNGIISVRLAD